MSLDDIREVGYQICKRSKKEKDAIPYGEMWTCIVDGKEITTSDYCKCGHLQKKKKKVKRWYRKV